MLERILGSQFRVHVFATALVTPSFDYCVVVNTDLTCLFLSPKSRWLGASMSISIRIRKGSSDGMNHYVVEN